MNHQEIRATLDDYVDGELDERSRQHIEAHLRTCAACRDEVAALRSLVADAGELPRSIEPPRDLWPGIDRRTGGGWRSRSLWSIRYQAAAAAVALIVVSSALTAWLVTGAGPQLAAPSASTGAASVAAGALARWRNAEEIYLQASAELSRALEDRKEQLDPATAELIEHNLRIIDRAIQESRAALAADPTNPELMEAVSARYRVKIEALQRLSRLTAQL